MAGVEELEHRFIGLDQRPLPGSSRGDGSLRGSGVSCSGLRTGPRAGLACAARGGAAACSFGCAGLAIGPAARRPDVAPSTGSTPGMSKADGRGVAPTSGAEWGLDKRCVGVVNAACSC